MQASELQLLDGSSAQEVLRLAGEARRRMDFFTHEDLVRAAAELDIPEDVVSEAERLVRERQSEADDRAEFLRAKHKEMWLGLAIVVPLVLILVLTKTLGGLAHHALSGFKMFLKGGTGLLFYRATTHEMDFRTWRAERMLQAEVGHKGIKGLIELYFKDRRGATYMDVLDWLSEQHGIDRHKGREALDADCEANPERYWHPVKTVRLGR